MLPPGVNSSLSDRLPKDKAARYIHCGMHATRSVGESIQSLAKHGKIWDEQAILERASDIEKFVRLAWGD